MSVDNHFGRVLNNINLEVTETIKKTHHELVFFKLAFIEILARLSYILVLTFAGHLFFSFIKSLYVWIKWKSDLYK